MWPHVSGGNFSLLFSILLLILSFCTLSSYAKSASIEIDEAISSKIFQGEWMIML